MGLRLLLLAALVVASGRADAIGSEASDVERDDILKISEFDTHEVNQVLQLRPRLSWPATDWSYVVARPKFLLLDSIPYKSSQGELARTPGSATSSWPWCSR